MSKTLDEVMAEQRALYRSNQNMRDPNDIEDPAITRLHFFRDLTTTQRYQVLERVEPGYARLGRPRLRHEALAAAFDSLMECRGEELARAVEDFKSKTYADQFVDEARDLWNGTAELDLNWIVREVLDKAEIPVTSDVQENADPKNPIYLTFPDGSRATFSPQEGNAWVQERTRVEEFS